MRKKLGQRQRLRSVTGIRLYRDNVEQLHSLLSGGGERRVKIDTDNYEIDDLNDLQNVPEEHIKGLRLRVSDPLVTVTFSSAGAYVHRLDDTTTAIGIAEHAHQFLRMHRLRLWRLMHWATGLLVAAVYLTLFLVGDFTTIDSRVGSGYVIAKWVIMVPAILIGPLSAWRGVVVYRSRRREVRSFWARNKDALVVGGVLAILGSALGSLITYLLTQS